MRILNDRLELSASDLANHLGCRHLSQLDLLAAKGRVTPPSQSGSPKFGFRHAEKLSRYAQASRGPPAAVRVVVVHRTLYPNVRL
jgi:hypothetical protein